MKTKKFSKEEYRKMVGELYGAAEMFWRDRLAGTVAVELLKKAAEMCGEEYVKGPKEDDED